MKPFITTTCLVFLLATLFACTAPKMPAERPDDFSITYHWDTGSLPPPYHYEINLTIPGPNSGGQLELLLGYSSNDEPPLREDFEMSEQQLDELYQKLVDEGLFTRKWKETNIPPMGAQVEWLTARAEGKEVYIPAYLASESAQDAADMIYASMRSLIPDHLWIWVDENVREYEARAHE